MTKKFVRQDSMRYSKIGKNRSKLQKWRKPKGRDSKMRLKRKSYPPSPTVGHRSSRKESGKIQDLTPKIIARPSDLEKLTKENIVIVSGKVGAKKKLEIIKKAQEMKFKILNLKENKK